MFLSSEGLVNLAEFVLKNSYFEFNSDVYRQISGTGMGTKLLLRVHVFL